ncbi:anti-sigma factor family protein [Paenibacillus tarimensis]|uniref:anti-sigma factor family protein n=1 Tax=Paenibacillus tarimensis TaxID=416012 RepID=UPI001F168984|nr:hypothetical protein [Paenibacillus tarimensis]MCF2942563.1 hypothetical protein [Paenibacillus tarimensis]
MNCREAEELFGIVWDLPENDPERLAFEQHLIECEGCAEQFAIWEESEAMIRDLSLEMPESAPIDHVNRGVMERIYKEESWLMPVTERSYRFTRSFRRNIAAAIASCMAMFVSGLFYFLFGYSGNSSSNEVVKMTGLIETADANNPGATISLDYYQEVPVASISDPLVLQVVPKIPEYWIALSILGIIMTLLFMNWLSRTRS